MVCVHSKLPVIGGSAIRIDSVEKVTGQTRYAEDQPFSDLLHAVVFRSPYHHAKLITLDFNQAREAPGVLRVVTAADIPGINGLDGYSREEPVLCPVGAMLKQKGAPIAIVVAETDELARQASDLIQAKFEEIPFIFQTNEALLSEAVQLSTSGNILNSFQIAHGDIDKAFKKSEIILETEYRTSLQEHSALERETAVGLYDQNGLLTVIAATHEPHWQRDYIAQTLGINPSQVHVVVPPTGGSFGGRQDPWPLVAVGLLAFLLHRPVRLAYSRQEVFEATPKRHPYQVQLKIGAYLDGNFTGIRARTTANTGAYDSAGYWIPNYAVTAGGGAYNWEAVDASARAVYTNAPKCGQFRGYGSPQAVFALECALDELAEKLEIDPIELRLKNCLHQGQISFLGYPLGETLAYDEILRILQPHFQKLSAEADNFNHSPRSSSERMGIGMAGMWYRFGKSGSLRIETHTELAIDGHFVIYCSAPDYGQGIGTVMVQLAAETLGISRSQIELVNADTYLTPDSGIQGASRATFFIGGSVCQAVENLKREILSVAAEMLDHEPGDLVFSDRTIGTLRDPDIQITYSEIAEEFRRLGKSRKVVGLFDLSEEFPEENRPEYIPLFVTGGQIAQVVVDLETGLTTVKKIVAAHDVGRTINPLDAVGQVEGAIVMGLGSALTEEYVPGLTSGFTDYLLPMIDSMPEMEVFLVEKPSYYGPLGAKGLGEAAILPTAPAIINAISRAIGTRIRQIPATPPRILEATKESIDYL